MYKILIYLVLILNVEKIKCEEGSNNDMNKSESVNQYMKYLLNRQGSDVNFTILAAKDGYESDEYTVQTEDGYLLTMFHIVNSNKCGRKKKSPPVIVQHGLEESSDSYIQAGPGIALGYLLADACYDVWFPNQRGNIYGKRNLYLNPDQKEFWKFSVDEIGLYDIPAIIDAVLYHTGAKKVNYIGHSQGCGTFYIMCSERPDYCRKVNLKISLAPATRHLNSKAIGFRSLILFNKFQDILESVGIYEAFPKYGVLQTFLNQLCQFKVAYPICIQVLNIVDGLNPGSIPESILKVLFSSIPAGTSVQNAARYGQALESEEFKKFDFGSIGNLKFYGSFSPPIYNLSAVTTPTVIFFGNNDGIVDKADVKNYVIPRLGNVIDVIEVADPLWTHFDFLYSQFIPKYLFGKINYYLNLFSY